MKKNTIKILLVIAILLVGGLSIYFYQKKHDVAVAENATTTNAVANSIDGQTLEYKNTERNFSLLYPKDMSFKDFDEGDTTHTIVFSDAKDEKSFQVFFTPYLGTQITESRILRDVPSGKFTEPVEVIIGGGVHALTFFDTQEGGDVREVWFIHDGYLFEVTTYKDLDTWLAGIMQSWNFFTGSSAGGQ